MIVPTIHTNGSSRDALLDQVCEAGNALREALRKIVNAAPNARDYYPQGDEAFRKAVAEHDARVTRVRAVLDEYVQLSEAIADAP